jgi:F-box-like
VWCGVGLVSQRVTIGSLPNNILIEIFDFYQVVINNGYRKYPWNWEKLVHVCQRWRYLIFDSPIRLNLRLFCKEKSPVKKLLDFWPPFPLVIQANLESCPKSELDNLDSEVSFHGDNVVAALERCDRVRQIDITNLPDYHRLLSFLPPPSH